MQYIGCHLSSSKGFAAMGKTALSIGANTFQFFTRNPRGGAAKDIDPQDAQALVLMQGSGEIGKIVAHAPYTLNPCAKEEKTLEFARTPCRTICAGWNLCREISITFTPEATSGRERKKASGKLPKRSIWRCSKGRRP